LLRLAAALEGKGWLLATAESCTGGLIAARLTGVPGASAWFWGGFVTYATAAKAQALGVPPELVAACGVVSEAVARAMAEGVLAHSPANLALSATGIAGPGGGTPQQPVGTVCLGWARRSQGTDNKGVSWARTFHFTGGREAVREAAVQAALSGALEAALA
jgi:nicotinamide-nucleotide amidase